MTQQSIFLTNIMGLSQFLARSTMLDASKSQVALQYEMENCLWADVSLVGGPLLKSIFKFLLNATLIWRKPATQISAMQTIVVCLRWWRYPLSKTNFTLQLRWNSQVN